MLKNETRQVPAEAFRLSVGQFAVGDSEGAAGNKAAPIKMKARSGQPIEHWFWGRIVHDLSGMKSKTRMPIDYCHDPGDIVGFLDKFEITSGDLEVSGKLTPFRDDDRCSEILAKSKAGVPYEASIFFDNAKCEYLDEGVTAQVNGFDFQGPGVIVRQWDLRGVAVCPWGADPNTSAQFSSHGREQTITVIQKETAMSKPTDQTAPKTTPAAAPVDAGKLATDQLAAPPAPAAVQAPAALAAVPAPGKAFMDTFGEAQGALYFAKGMSMEEALKAHVQFQASQISELNTKLSKAPSAERGTDPVNFKDGETAKKGKGLASCIRIGGKS